MTYVPAPNCSRRIAPNAMAPMRAEGLRRRRCVPRAFPRCRPRDSSQSLPMAGCGAACRHGLGFLTSAAGKSCRICARSVRRMQVGPTRLQLVRRLVERWIDLVEERLRHVLQRPCVARRITKRLRFVSGSWQNRIVASLRRNPYPLYAAMRRIAPVMHDRFHDLWLLFDFDSVKRALNDHETFSSRASPPGGKALDWLIFQDPPLHTRLRGIVMRRSRRAPSPASSLASPNAPTRCSTGSSLWEEWISSRILPSGFR